MPPAVTPATQDPLFAHSLGQRMVVRGASAFVPRGGPALKISFPPAVVLGEVLAAIAVAAAASLELIREWLRSGTPRSADESGV